MSADVQANHDSQPAPTKKPRSDKGKKRNSPNASGALSSVLIAIQDLGREDAKRVILAAATFFGIKLIETTEAR